MALGRRGILITQLSALAKLACVPGEWALNQESAPGVAASVTKAAAAGVSHVCRSITISVDSIVVGGFALCVLRDGLSGVGAILWSAYGVVLSPIYMSDLNIVGTAGNAMTLEFTTPIAATAQVLTLTGYDAS